MDGRRAPAQPAAEVRPGQGRGATAGPRGAAPPAGRVTVSVRDRVRGRTDAGTSLQGPPGHGPGPGPTPFWALPGVTPDPGEGVPRAEATRHVSGPVWCPSPRQGPSLCPLSKALPWLGGSVASHPPVPGPAALALP
ncbi:REPIN1 isoform 15 [Pan troglodytes]|uniref:Replication initiator 1 n=2 Tax=Pan troglodytes TaxID=9598 RepID=A0A2I3RK74_PANTR|nr:REPIN1 isoform 15 [Pan troglodytes]